MQDQDDKRADIGTAEDGVEETAEQAQQLVLNTDTLPTHLHILPQENRPFFPGQAVPLLMSAATWLPTLMGIKETGQNWVGLVAVDTKPTGDVPEPGDLYRVGTLCRIHRVHQENDVLQVLLEGVRRFRVEDWTRTEVPLLASVRYLSEPPVRDVDEVKAYAVALINTIKEIIPLNPLYGEELKVFLARSNPNEPSMLADFAASMTSASKEELQELLETLPILPRLEMALGLLNKEVQIARAQMDIREHIEQEIQGHQREAFLREQLKFIQKELGLAKDDKTADIEMFRERLEDRVVPDEARAKIDEELAKLSMLEIGSPEFGVTRNYLDWVTSVPWGVYSQDIDDLSTAEATLESTHEGLADAKARIIEHLGVGIMRGDVSGAILLLVGPPGVGKTSLGRSIARAMGREFYRFSVGGMRDEAEIKGHRRTYIGAMPGKLIQALKDCETANPVILLDEVDKIGASYQGDPASALLEVLDPEQNSAFRDHYIDMDVDLSKVLFVCTANQLDTIPAPLLDRMETIELAGYLAAEKLLIARKHLWPRQLARAGLKQRGDLRMDTAALRRIIDGYSREAGVRRLEKALGTVVRKAVLKLLRGAPRPIRVRADDIETYLGRPIYEDEQRTLGVGVVTGLAWTAAGGATLPVEATSVHKKGAGIKLTGQLGDVMKESAEIAYSFVRANAEQFGVDPDFFAERMLHLHVPAGATPKDGPSAGVTMATALLSLGHSKAIDKHTAMTGELTLTGQVYPVGGIREKLLAARRQKIRRIILPEANRREFEEVPEAVREGLTIHFVKHFADVAALVLPTSTAAGDKNKAENRKKAESKNKDKDKDKKKDKSKNGAAATATAAAGKRQRTRSQTPARAPKAGPKKVT